MAFQARDDDAEIEVEIVGPGPIRDDRGQQGGEILCRKLVERTCHFRCLMVQPRFRATQHVVGCGHRDTRDEGQDPARVIDGEAGSGQHHEHRSASARPAVPPTPPEPEVRRGHPAAQYTVPDADA